MATETGPDLTAGREAIEAMMDDTCDIRFDAQGTKDDTLDLSTGNLTPPSPDDTLVYSGRCKIRPWGQDQPRKREVGDLTDRPRWYQLAIPLSAPVPQRGAVATLTSSRRDDWLVDKVFIVREVLGGTFSISRKMMVELSQ